MHNKFSLSVTLNAVKGLKKIPHCVRNDKFFVQFLDLLIYSTYFNSDYKLIIICFYSPFMQTADTPASIGGLHYKWANL